jgi:Zn-dependent peptidase ImmA (M78 family)
LYDSSGLGNDESGCIDFAQKLITIRDDETETRQRFSLAHEVGHLRLHARRVDLLTAPIPGLLGDSSRPHLSRRASKEWHEVEANRFAAALLMPERLLRPAFERARAKFQYLMQEPAKMQADVASQLASDFQVSAQAMDLRLKTTGLASELFTDRLL